MRARALPLLLLFLLAARSTQAQDVRTGVLVRIFHPRHLTLSCTGSETLVVATADQTIFLQPRSAHESLQIRTDGNTLLLSLNGREIHANEIQATSWNNGAASASRARKNKPAIPGHFGCESHSRRIGTSRNHGSGDAVASAVQAESSPGTPLEALKGQAVVTRSCFVAGRGRHTDFDFCDLTHCQFLREPPPESPAAVAASATKDLIINFEEKPVAAKFTRSWSGATRTPADIGIPTNGYSYFSVVCDFLLQKSGTLDGNRISARCRAS
jgi:hypothetical protein